MDANRFSGRALAPRRHDEILKRLAADGSVGITDLAAFFDVSRETIRRDLKHLSEAGRLDLIHGGATRFQPHEPAIDLRAGSNAAGKAAIGKLAADLVENGMVLFLDSGTTTLAIAQALAARKNLTICTASLKIALLMCHRPGIRVHILGGEVDATEEAATGVDVIEAALRFRVDIAFLGAGALSPDGEVTDFTRNGAELRSRMILLAKAAYFVVDSSKFGKLTPLRVANSERVAGIISDRAPAAEIGEALMRRGTKLLSPQ